MTNAACFKDNAETKAILAIGKALDGLTPTTQKRVVGYFYDVTIERVEQQGVAVPPVQGGEQHA